MPVPAGTDLPMELTTCLLPSHAGLGHDTLVEEPSVDVAVVIDVLRATTVMVTALDAGARRVLTCREVREAQQLAGAVGGQALLCGERGCRRIEGFDLGNSPAEYRPESVRGRDLVLTTTNGTQAIAAAGKATRVLIASFLNLSAVVAAIGDTDRVQLICAGTEGKVTLEDVLLAGALVWKCHLERRVAACDDPSLLAQELWRSWFAKETAGGLLPAADAISRRFRETQGGKNLLRLGYDADLDRCAAIDTVPVVPEQLVASPATFALRGDLSGGGCAGEGQEATP